jgi:hypothetical protein
LVEEQCVVAAPGAVVDVHCFEVQMVKNMAARIISGTKRDNIPPVLVAMLSRE